MSIKKIFILCITFFLTMIICIMVFNKKEQIQETRGISRSDEISDLKSYLESNPKDVNSLNKLGLDYHLNEQLDDAIDAYKKILKIEPQNTIALFNIANINVDKGEFNEAIKWYDEFSKIEPENPASYLAMSTVLLLTDKNQALELAEKAMSKKNNTDNPNFIETYVELVKNVKQGSKDGKYNAYLKILTDYINSDRLKNTLIDKILEDLPSISSEQRDKIIGMKSKR